MSAAEIGTLLVTLSVLLGAVHTLGYVFDRFRQPRVAGEILAGILLGPFVLGHFLPGLSESIFGNAANASKMQTILGFLYWIGLMLLMFVSGAETRRLMAKENQRETIWLLTVGLLIPFIAVVLAGRAGWLPLHTVTGTAGSTLSALLIVAIAVTVTSIPVISRIFLDLKILKTRFASLILGMAILEDIILWSVLAIATGLVTTSNPLTVLEHVVSTIGYMLLGMTLMPRILKVLHGWRLNLLIKASPVGYLFFILFVYGAIAAVFQVNMIFASFLAGFGIVGGFLGDQRTRFSESIESISKIAFGFFIPVYFAVVGYKLVFGRDFSFGLLFGFLIGSSLLSILARSLAARLGGFRGLDVANIAIASNARGGPGIVLASVAYDAGIINGAFYTTLVLCAILTSQAAGAWLRFVLSKGWPLLSSQPLNKEAEAPDAKAGACAAQPGA